MIPWHGTGGRFPTCNRHRTTRRVLKPPTQHTTYAISAPSCNPICPPALPSAAGHQRQEIPTYPACCRPGPNWVRSSHLMKDHAEKLGRWEDVRGVGRPRLHVVQELQFSVGCRKYAATSRTDWNICEAGLCFPTTVARPCSSISGCHRRLVHTNTSTPIYVTATSARCFSARYSPTRLVQYR
ncbi:MAG: hypothetical protein GPOALKHO_000823 [Sodalis sp.]|nr:MAG: hypothetical protein GPOALKHO_000823 [Sodalis sp.]